METAGLRKVIEQFFRSSACWELHSGFSIPVFARPALVCGEEFQDSHKYSIQLRNQK